MSWALGVHGGAGLIRREDVSPAREAAARAGLADALEAGAEVLAGGGVALDAVQAAVLALEEAEVFNAARGSVIAGDGAVWMDAGLADGDGRFGGVANLRTTRNPVLAARAALDEGVHVLLSGVDAWARSRGLEQVDPAWLRTPERLEQWHRLIASGGGVALDHDTRGTVGAVARDVHGGFAAGNSTGGMTNKHPGRIGDSPVPGAGTWADARCAIAATGDGEKFLRTAFAHRIARDVHHGVTLAEAVDDALAAVAALNGSGGALVVDARHLLLPFNSGGMYRGSASPEGRQIAIF